MQDPLDQLQTALAGRYAIEGTIGVGGMATVYLAEDLKHHRQVAVKVLRPELAAAVGADRLLREIEITAKLQHPRILTLIDSGSASGLIYYVMPYVTGGSLRAKLDREKQLSVSEALNIAGAVASALEYAHGQGIVHRDVKPENILMSEGEPVVADFGIALAMTRAGKGRLTETGLSLGTPEYMSPEQALGDPSVDCRSDVYSLGCVLYEMLAGEPPYTGPNPRSVVAKIVSAPVPSVRTVRDTVSESIDRALIRALAKAPADRFETAGAFADAIKSPRRSSATELKRIVAGRPRLTAVTGFVALLAGIGLTMLWMRLQAPPRFSGITPDGRLSLLLSTQAEASDPALSPDGRLLAYLVREVRRTDLFVRAVAGGQVFQVTDDSSGESAPVFSPDGESIAFARFASVGETRGVWIVPALGGTAAPVLDGADHPTWSPNGERLALVRTLPGEADALVTVRRDGSDLRLVFRNAAPYLHLRGLTWSPNGREIAFIRSTGGVAGEVWIASLEDGGVRRLTADPPGVHSDFPAYTPDGRGIVHSSNRSGTTNLWILPVDGGEPIRLTTGSGPDEAASVARDGTIAFSNSRWHSELYVHDLRTGRRRQLHRHSSSLWGAAFSPNGQLVAISQLEVDGSWHIMAVPLAGGAPRQLTFGTPPQIYPRFTPDGEFVIYQTWVTDSGRVWRVPLSGGAPVPLTEPGENASYADVSPDGAQLAYVRNEDVERIYVAPLGGGEPRLLSEGAGSLPRWSPDGRWIAFSRDRSYTSGIFIIRPDGTDERRLTSTGGWPVWWPDGTRIGYRIIGPDGTQQIHVIPVEGGEPVHMDEFVFTDDNSPFDISADGRSLATTRSLHLADEIWLMRPGSR